MGYNHQRIKTNAQTFYKNNSGRAIIAVLIYTAIALGCSGLSGATGGLLSIGLGFFVLNIVAMGTMGWFRESIYSEKQPGDIFNVFNVNYMGKVGTLALQGLYIFLWSLLFVVPGMIKMYEYSMVQYIKEENPNIPADRCFKLSKALTDGHKADLCYLDLSFIGWYILSGLTAGILWVAYVGPYYLAAKAFAYEELKAEAAAMGKIDLAEITGGYSQFGQYTNNSGSAGYGQSTAGVNFNSGSYGQNNQNTNGYGSNEFSGDAQQRMNPYSQGGFGQSDTNPSGYDSNGFSGDAQQRMNPYSQGGFGQSDTNPSGYGSNGFFGDAQGMNSYNQGGSAPSELNPNGYGSDVFGELKNDDSNIYYTPDDD